jgi:hypothetical protein
MITEIASGDPGDLAMMLATYPISYNREELYADMFLQSDGGETNMPLEFRQFYDWKLAEKLVEEYER